uniref:YKR005C-like protein n=1 Tax=Elaeophora elaphi TaxID=1147741 RepID=A0A0R3S0V9_9BILA
MSHTITSDKGFKFYSQGRISLTDRGVNEQCVRPENGYKRHSAKKPVRKGCRETITALQNSNSFQKPFVMNRSQSMTDLGNECREIAQSCSKQNVASMNNGTIHLIHASNSSQMPTTKMTTNSGCVYRSGSLKNFKMPTTEGVRRILSREKINLADNFRTNNVRTNSPNNNLKSLVSFDPKSNVLLRIHNHIDDDDDDDDYDRNDSSTHHTDTIQQQQQLLLQQQQRSIPRKVNKSLAVNKF